MPAESLPITSQVASSSSIHGEGGVPHFHEETLSHSQLLLDPNNYRYQDGADFVYADEKRFHEASVQDRAFRRLRADEGLGQLKSSFLTNGFIPVERLVVRRYQYAADRYVVLEGNRRLAALRWIAQDHEAGVRVPRGVLESLESVPVVIVDDDADASFYESLMGVRHVSGIKQWGGYQRAKLVFTLKETHGLSSSDVAGRLGMSAQEVNRRYRAFKALQQMQSDEDFGGHAKPDMYPLFHEAVSVPVVREWLGWDERIGTFTNDEQVKNLYRLITPGQDDEEQTREPKITTYLQIRELRDIIPNPEAQRILLDPTRSFFDAMTLAKREELSRSWATQVAEAIGALQNISVIDLQRLTTEDMDQIVKLRDLADNIVSTYKKLTS
ncbi:MAG: hypothetical protein QOF89_1102 [Acidobacteriota bacterium]|jgi:ParB-like chromosome segregation protein Spo0J|nr:hypothetical protein [Acidobacteriota bacterium]